MAITTTSQMLGSMRLSALVLTSIEGEASKVDVSPETFSNSYKVATISVDDVPIEISAKEDKKYLGDGKTISCDEETGTFGAMMSAFVAPIRKDVDVNALTLEQCLSVLIESVGGTV